MKAFILAAGVGSRLSAMTDVLPKVLVPVQGMSILERLIDSLLLEGVTDIVIATGYLSDRIQEFMSSKEKYQELTVTYVHNERYAETNYIYSMWLAREVLAHDDLLLFHGDMVCDQSVIHRIVAGAGSAVAVCTAGALSTKDFTARVENGCVKEIGVGITGDEVHPCMPVYRWTAADFSRWMTEIDHLIAEGNVTCYAEEAFNRTSDAFCLSPMWYEPTELCMEVDTPEDVGIAEEALSGRRTA